MFGTFDLPRDHTLPWLLLLGVSLAALLRADLRGLGRVALLAKTVASACFVAIGLSCVDTTQGFDRLVLLGLVLAALGDVALALPGERAFRVGVGLFALGHLGYAAAALLAGAEPEPLALLVVLPSALAYRWLYPRLGAMRVLVLVYVLIISLMLGAAFMLYAQCGARAGLFVLGAAAFYLSDLSVARDRFVRASFVNRAWGLPAYYAGQVCIALSTTQL